MLCQFLLAKRLMDSFNLEEWLSSVTSVYQGLKFDIRQRVLITLATCSSAAEICQFMKKLKQLTMRDFIRQLPAELVDHLLVYLDYRTILTACRVRVSKVWLKKLSENGRLWKRMCRLQGIEVLNYNEEIAKSLDRSPEHQAQALFKSENAKETTQERLLEALSVFELCDGSPGTSSLTADSGDALGIHHDLMYDTPRAVFLRRMFFLKLFYSNRLTECVQLSGHSQRVSAMFYHHGTLATGSDDRTVRLWDTSTTDCRCRAVIDVGHSVSALKFDNTLMVIGSFNADLTLWDLGCPKPCRLRRYDGNTAAVFCVDFSVTFDSIFSGTAGSEVSHWALTTGELRSVIRTSTIPRSVLCLRIVDGYGRPLSDQYGLVVSNNVEVSMWMLHPGTTEPEPLMCRLSDTKSLRVIPRDESQCLITEVRSNRGTESALLVYEVVQLQWRQRASAHGAAGLQFGSGGGFEVGVALVESRVVSNAQICDIFVLGAGAAFSISVERYANKLNIARHTSGTPSNATDVCSLDSLSNQTWLTARCPVATACDTYWLEHGFNEDLYQTIAAVSLKNNNIAVFRRTKVAQSVSKDSVLS